LLNVCKSSNLSGVGIPRMTGETITLLGFIMAQSGNEMEAMDSRNKNKIFAYLTARITCHNSWSIVYKMSSTSSVHLSHVQSGQVRGQSQSVTHDEIERPVFDQHAVNGSSCMIWSNWVSKYLYPAKVCYTYRTLIDATSEQKARSNCAPSYNAQWDDI
jgi:hypothetical protein